MYPATQIVEILTKTSLELLRRKKVGKLDKESRIEVPILRERVSS